MRLPSTGTCAMVVARALVLGTLASEGKALTSVIFPGPFHGSGGLCSDTRCLEVTRCTRRYVESRDFRSMTMSSGVRSYGLENCNDVSEDVTAQERKTPTLRGVLRRLRCFLRRKAVTAALVSTAFSAASPVRANALFERSKSSGMSPSGSLEQLVGKAANGETEKGEDLSDFTASAAERLEGDPLGSLGDTEGHLTEVHLESSGDNSLPTAFSEINMDNIHGEIAVGEGSLSSEGIPSTWEKRTSPVEQATGITERIRYVGRVARENSQVTAIAIVGAAGATVLISRSSDSRGVGRRNPYKFRDGRTERAPASPVAGIGKPRVSPEVEAAKAKAQEDTLKKLDFDVDLELFDDADNDVPTRPPAAEASSSLSSSPSRMEAIQEDTSAKQGNGESVGSANESPPASSTMSETDVRTSLDSEAVAVAKIETPPAEEASSISEPPAKKETRSRPMMNLFRRNTGPQRATTLEEALSAETPREADFRKAVAASLTRFAPPGFFAVAEHPALANPDEKTEDEGDDTSKESRAVAALSGVAEIAGLSTKESADAVAEVVNAMVVSLVDAAVDGSSNDAKTSSAVDTLLSYMDGAGGLFAALCPGIELNPPIKYNGATKRGKLEKVFEAAARNALKTGDEGQMGKLDRLQDMFSIKEGKANSITQKIMMDLMMKMMSEGGDEDTGGFEKMMKAMGGGMPGAGGAKSPEEMKAEVQALKAMVELGDVPKEEVDALRKMYKDAGMDIDQLVNDPAMEGSLDENAKEVVGLLRKLLATTP